MEIEPMPRGNPPSAEPDISPVTGGSTAGRGRALRLFWLCLGLGLFAVIVLAWRFGLTWWTVLIAALMIACPAIAAWIFLGGLDSWPKPPRTDR